MKIFNIFTKIYKETDYFLYTYFSITFIAFQKLIIIINERRKRFHINYRNHHLYVFNF